MGVHVIPNDQDPRPKEAPILKRFRFDPNDFPPLPPVVRTTATQDYIRGTTAKLAESKGQTLKDELKHRLTLSRYARRYFR